MAIIEAAPTRTTSADLVFKHLYDLIITLKLMPGTKMSEAEIAEQFGISRQPVRDAFNRLSNLDLLLIQPQKATVVQRFSMKTIEATRFIRLALELELARVAARNWSDAHLQKFEQNMKRQAKTAMDGDGPTFHALDDAFHVLIAEAADKAFASEIIQRNKAQVDRICLLSLKDVEEIRLLVGDHQSIFECIAENRLPELEAHIRTHLTRIDQTIEKVRESHADYFLP